jgi:hypothetical protein
LRVFYAHVDLYKEQKSFGLYLMNFSLFWAQKAYFRAERYENKEKCIFYFGLRILLSVQIQLLDIENPKIDSPYCTQCTAYHHIAKKKIF